MFTVQGLRVSYGQSQIIKGVTFGAKPNETLAIVGRNGMGKTTLMKSLIGILKSKEGSIYVGEREVSDLESYERVKCGLAYVPQGRQIFPTLTVEENIRTGLDVVRKRKIDESIFQLFPVLKEMRKRKGGNLSGGQQQQLAIARALVTEPKILLLDEPTEGIQPSIVKDIAKILNELKRLREITIVVSEQVLSFTLAIADRILVMEGGAIVCEEARSGANEEKIARYLAV
jgi:urea transport system ATP-binding protein